MPHVLIRHKVKDFTSWKPVFDEHASTRKAAGSKGGILFRSAGDPNEVVIIFDWENVEHARRFIESEDLRETMQRAGVADRPDIYFLDEVDRPAS
ncbi:MAG: cyclase [Acidiferrobacterales bacterium]